MLCGMRHNSILVSYVNNLCFTFQHVIDQICSKLEKLKWSQISDGPIVPDGVFVTDIKGRWRFCFEKWVVMRVIEREREREKSKAWSSFSCHSLPALPNLTFKPQMVNS